MLEKKIKFEAWLEMSFDAPFFKYRGNGSLHTLVGDGLRPETHYIFLQKHRSTRHARYKTNMKYTTHGFLSL